MNTQKRLKISYDYEIAKQYGLHESIIINDIAYWIKQNQNNGRNYTDNYYWTYNTYSYFSDFLCVTTKTIQRIMNKLEKLNIIKIGNYNKWKNDHTKWYTIIDEEIAKIYDIELSHTIEEYTEEIEEQSTELHSDTQITQTQFLMFYNSYKHKIEKSHNKYIEQIKQYEVITEYEYSPDKLYDRILQKHRTLKDISLNSLITEYEEYMNREIYSYKQTYKRWHS